MLAKVDEWLMRPGRFQSLSGLRLGMVEFLFFGLKQARACLFAGLFFLSVFLMPDDGILGIAKYDALLVVAVLLQAAMIWLKLETLDELKAVCLFHLVGFILEVFKTHPSIGSWSYPGDGLIKLFGVPLFSGFMYAAVGSYMIQAWRLFDLRIHHHPAYWMATLTAVLIYLNFFTHHFIGDYRWYLASFSLGLYARTMVTFRPIARVHKMPLLLAFVLIGFFIWLAENISTLLGIWAYPDQLGAWSVVHLSKWSAWSMLVIMTFTIITHLKHIKATVHIPLPHDRVETNPAQHTAEL